MTQPSAPTAPAPTAPAPPAERSTPSSTGSSTDLVKTGSTALKTSEGSITVAEGVVVKVAGVAAREISGVHSMGSGASRAFGALKQKIPGTSSAPSVSSGVSVEVGETQAAIDLNLIVEYGVSIADLGRAVQKNVKEAVEGMTGLEVTEVNVSVDDVYLGDTEDDNDTEDKAPRVQ